MKRTRIVCTIGPASARAATLRAMVRAGMNVARLNFSHGTHASHAQTLALVREAARREGETVAVLADLQGPKIRLGELPKEGVELSPDATVRFTTVPGPYRAGEAIPVTYAGLHKDVRAGHRILIDDGLLEVRVASVRGREIEARVVHGGRVTSHKGMNFPDSELHVDAITAKDREDAAFAVRQGVDWIALSFVTKPSQVAALRRIVRSALPRGAREPRLIVKIEKHEAVACFDGLLEAVDAVMVARGDLGVEIPPAQVPVVQKMMVEKCLRAGKPVVVATQMLDSMIRNPRPTRAEASDVANAVFDHVDAVMLSGETASGLYPVEAVKAMAAIVCEAEASPYDDLPMPGRSASTLADSTALALKAMTVSGHVDAALAFIEQAPWAARTLTLRPEIPFFLAAPDEAAARAEVLRWGVEPFVLKMRTAKARSRAFTILKKDKRLHAGMRVAVMEGGSHGVGIDLVDVK